MMFTFASSSPQPQFLFLQDSALAALGNFSLCWEYMSIPLPPPLSTSNLGMMMLFLSYLIPSVYLSTYFELIP